MAQEHWAQNGFFHTDLDFLLGRHGIKHVVIVGLRVNTCIDATARYAMELGYRVTLVTDATAGFSSAEMDATFKVNAPSYADSVIDTTRFVDLMSLTDQKEAHET